MNASFLKASPTFPPSAPPGMPSEDEGTPSKISGVLLKSQYFNIILGQVLFVCIVMTFDLGEFILSGFSLMVRSFTFALSV